MIAEIPMSCPQSVWDFRFRNARERANQKDGNHFNGEFGLAPNLA
jgi:hypothetical protein